MKVLQVCGRLGWAGCRTWSRPSSSSSSVAGAVMAIRREDGHSPWERRAPLSPNDIGKLVKKGVKVLVQPSNRRAYPMAAYQKVGAVIMEDISEASLIVGVKQVPVDRLIPEKTYAFFSHTIKAQEPNMPLLDSMLKKNIRLFDYEKMVDDAGQRVVAFGKYAGVAGMINILHGLGIRLLALGHHTPFMFIGPAHNYRNTWMAKQALRDAGYEISIGMMPKSIGPLTFVFTGSGNVSQGAQEIFQELPHEYVEPEHLAAAAHKGAPHKVYGCVVSREDHYVRKDRGGFDAQEFEEFPDRYYSVFSQKYAPYASCIINGIYYAPNSPRLLTIPCAKRLLSPLESPWLPHSEGCPQLPHRLLALCDISADPGGSIEFMNECTTIDKPFILYDADENIDTESFSGPGVLMCSVDNMPAQIPREATDFFGGLLLPHVYEMLKSNAQTSFEQLDCSRVIKDATICSNGELTPNFQYIADLRKKANNVKWKKSPGVEGESRKNVLILGAGYVSAPVVEYLTERPDINVTVASALREEVDGLASRFPNVDPVLLDVTENSQDLEDLIPAHDLAISLLPYNYHARIAKSCIDHKVNLVTASYTSPEMMELHQRAVDASVTIINEVGVDPGIDHMLAMQCFDDVREEGGKITSYVSWCGGLPAPEDSENPLLYKFSWFPRGVLTNAVAAAKYLQDGQVVEIPPGGSILESVHDIGFMPGFALEGIPNRDSTHYASLYNIENAHTILRGTLRFKGFSEAMSALVKLGFMSDEAKHTLHPTGPAITWRQYVCEGLGIDPDILQGTLEDEVLRALGGNQKLLDTIVGLGLLEHSEVDKKGTPVDTLANYLAKRCSFGPDERDLLLMRHLIGVEWADGRTETRNVNFCVYGDRGGYSAMAKTVGYPTGIVARMVLDGEIQTPGVVLPFAPQIYRPVLNRLKQRDIFGTETIDPHY